MGMPTSIYGVKLWKNEIFRIGDDPHGDDPHGDDPHGYHLELFLDIEC